LWKELGLDMQHKTTLTLAFIFFFINHTDASDPAIRAVYGDGVHSYYAGNFQQSYDFLSRVITFGTDDPSVYYFRGLCALRLGNQNNAADDFEKGADLEAERQNSRTVSRALVRIQGPTRMLLEESRTKARLLIAKRQGTASGSPGSSVLSRGRRYSGIGGKTPQPSSQPPKKATPAAMATVEPETPSAESNALTQPAPESVTSESPQQPDEESAMTPPTESQKTKSLLDDPFGDDPFADKPRRTDPLPTDAKLDVDTETMSASDSDDPFNFAPRKPTGSSTQRDQIEMQNEMLDAESTNSRDQREAMNERDAAAGD
jgi:hypothetical protein